MLRRFLAAALAGTALFGAAAAQAGTSWSIGIHLPVDGVVIASGGPRYHVHPPVPVYHAPPRVVYREVYHAPPPRVVYETHYRDRDWDRHGGHWHRDRGQRHHHRHHHHGHHGHQHRWDSDHGPRRGH